MLNKRLHIISLLFTWIFFLVFTNAQEVSLSNFSFHVLPTQDLLPTSNTGIIFQDSEGYFWYGTDGEGLCRDDAYSIMVVSSKTYGKGIMKSNEITCISEDQEGLLWFGTRSGLYTYNKKSNEVRRIKHELLNQKKVNAICTGNDGCIWVGAAQTVIKFDKNGKILKEYSIGTNTRKEVKEFMLDSKGTLWVTTLRGGLYAIEKGKDTLHEMPWNIEEATSYIIEDPSHKFYWIGTWGAGVVRYSPNGEITQLQKTSNGDNKFSTEVNNMYLDAKHSIMWVSTMDNLYAFHVTDGQLIPLNTSKLLPQGNKIIGKIMCDRNGNIWVPGVTPHTFAISWTSGGIIRNDANTANREIKLTADRIIREGDYFWIYQRRTRLSLYNSVTGEMTDMALNAIPTPLSTQKVIAKCKTKKGIWTCNGKHLIHVWNEGMKIHWEEDSLGHTPNYIASLYDHGDGILYIGTEIQAFRYDYQKGKMTKLTDSVGVVHHVGFSKGFEYSTDPKYLPTITDGNGHIWSLTETSLKEINPKTGAYRIINADDNNVGMEGFTDLTIDNSGTLCLGGIGAFCMLSPCKELDSSNNDSKIILVDSTHVSCLNHLHSRIIQYAYRFHDTDEWIELVPGDNTISYDGLEYGDYVLEVKCTDEYGRWTKPQVLDSFSIPTPIYLRWYMLLVYAIITGGIVLFIFNRRKKQKETQDAAGSNANPTAVAEEATYTNRDAEEFIQLTTSIIHKNLDNPNYDVDQLASDMNLSRSNLYRRFQKYSAVNSPSEYIRNIRIEEGKRLLRETSESITEIAYKVGFSSSQYFAKCFKDAYGMTPKEWRNKKS